MVAPPLLQCLEKNASGAMTYADLKHMFSMLLIDKSDLSKVTLVLGDVVTIGDTGRWSYSGISVMSWCLQCHQCDIIMM